MKLHLFKNEVFIKFITSFFITLLFPIIIITIVFNSYFINIYKENFIRQNSLNFDAYQIKIDSFLKSCDAIAVQIPNTDGFSAQQLKNFKTSYSKIKRILAAYQISQSFCNEVKFYSFHNAQAIYAANGTTNPYYYCRYGENQITLSELLNGKNKSFWVNAISFEGSKPKEILQYIVPVVGRDRDFVIFDVDLKLFDDMSTSSSVTNEIFYDGNLIYSTNENIDKNPDEITVLTGNSTISPIEYRRYIPTHILTKQISQLQFIFIYVMIAIILVGGMFVYFISVARYLPIKKLTALANDVFPDIPKSIGEIESIGFAINHFGLRNEEYMLKDALKKLFYSLIYKQYNDVKDVVKRCLDASLFLEGKKWRVSILTITAFEQFENISIEKICTDILETEYETYFLDYSSKRYYIIILGSERDSIELLNNKLSAIIDTIDIRFSKNASFFVGGCYDSIEGFSKSYNEAVLNSDRNASVGISFYEPTLRQEKKMTIYPKIELDSLHTSIIENDQERISFFTNVLTESVIDNNYSNFMRVSICHDIIAIYLNSTEELSICNKYFSEMKNIEYQIKPSCTIDEYFDAIIRLERTIIKAISLTPKVDVVEVNEEIKEFIDTYPDISHLCVSFVAEHFGISISNLSHRFKNQTGMNVSNYIVAKRIEYSKKLLVDTEMNLAEIAGKLSYCHTNSFMRVFKNVVGITPGEYRRMFASKKEKEK